MHKYNIRPVLYMSLAAILAACSFTPHYTVPQVETGESFKELSASDTTQWKQAASDAGIADTTSWWQVFQDPQLDALEQQAMAKNNELQAAFSRIEQAEAIAASARSKFFPTVTANAGYTAQDLGPNDKPTHDYNVSMAVSYGLDLFGRVRSAAKIANLTKQESEALYRQVLLFLQADVAQNYFMSLALQSEYQLLTKATESREAFANLVQKRYTEGEAGQQELLRAQAELANTRANLEVVKQQQAASQHALAVLLGVVPSQLGNSFQGLSEAPPQIPAGLPSEMLERRPDIAAAQLELAAANERIGLARAAFFPSVTLTGEGGITSPQLSDVFNWSSRSWLFGPVISLPIFEGGARVAQLKQSQAVFEESVSNYRQKVLVAFKETEDALAAIQHLKAQQKELNKAVEAMRQADAIAMNRYREGEAPYSEVLDTQRDLLVAQRAEVQTRGDLFINTIQLIRALGGGWLSSGGAHE